MKQLQNAAGCELVENLPDGLVNVTTGERKSEPPAADPQKTELSPGAIALAQIITKVLFGR